MKSSIIKIILLLLIPVLFLISLYLVHNHAQGEAMRSFGREIAFILQRANAGDEDAKNFIASLSIITPKITDEKIKESLRRIIEEKK